MSTSISQHFSPWSLLKFTFSSIIMMMFMSLYTIVDGIFISRFIGSNALSSLNIVYPVASIVIAIGTMLATGGNAVISRYLGEEKIQLAKECLSLFTLTGFLLSLLMSILSLLFPDFISRALGANDLLLADCRTYLSILMGFAPACMLQTLFQSYLVTAGAPGSSTRDWTMYLSYPAILALPELPWLPDLARWYRPWQDWSFF